jgi:hypothetical protein
MPVPPITSTKILIPLSDEKKQANPDTLNNVNSLLKEISKWSCEVGNFGDFMETLEINAEQYITALHSDLKRPTVFLRRPLNDVNTNTYNPLCHSNRDLHTFWTLMSVFSTF